MKKFLAFVLAMMMVFSLFVTVNAADAADTDAADTASTGTKFTDLEDADKAYQSALEALYKSGAMEGYDDGSFAPNKSLTRKEYAVILFRIAATEEEMTEANLAKWAQLAVDTYSDIDNPNAWYASAVGYLYENKIMVGVADGVFADENDPTIKGREAFITLLRTLGLVVNNNEFTDSAPNGYNPQAAIDRARKYKLDDGLTTADNDDSVLKGAITRQTVAQLMANALVETGWHYTNTDADGVPQFKENKGKTLGAKFGLKKLTEDEAKDIEDPFNRPAVTKGYVVGDEVIVTKREAELVATFTGKVTGKNITDKIGKTAAGYETWFTIEDGGEPSTGKPAPTKDVNTNGVTEVYVNSKTETVTIVVINKYVKVLGSGDIVAATKKAKAYIVLAKDLTLETEDYAKGDVVVYTYGKDAKKNKVVDTITKVEDTVTGTLEKINSGTTYIIDGTAYPKSTIKDSNTVALSDFGKEYTVWLYDGAVVYAKLADGTVVDDKTADYIFALHSHLEEYVVDGKIVKVVEVDGIDKNGNFITIPVDACYTSNGTATNDFSDNTKAGKFNTGDVVTDGTPVVYICVEGSVNEDRYDLYNATAAAAVSDEDLNAAAATISYGAVGDSGSDSNLEIGGTTKLTGSSATGGATANLKVSASTKYYVAINSDATGKYKYTGVTPYTGYAAIGNINKAAKDGGAQGKKAAAIDFDGNKIADVVFVDAYASDSSIPYAYVLKDYVEDDDGFHYTAIIDGEEQELVLSKKVDATIKLPALVKITDTAGKLTAEKLDQANPTLSDVETTETVLLSNKASFFYNGTLLMTVGKPDTYVGVIGKDVPVYIFNDGEVEVLKASEMTTARTGAVVVIASNGTDIIALYIIEDAKPTEGTPATIVGSQVEDEVTADDGEIVVSGKDGGSLHSEGGYKQGSQVSTDDITKVTKGKDATCDEAIDFTGDSAKPSQAEDGMIFKTEDGSKFQDKDGKAVSKQGRTEISFTFTLPKANDKASVTITLTHVDEDGNERVITDTAKDVSEGKHFWLVCPENLNDGDPKHNQFTDSKGKVLGAEKDASEEKNSLESGYWTVSIDLTESPKTNLFTGGFTVD